MPRLAANVSMMYCEVGLLERFAAAARDGFRGVELQYPYELPARDLRARLDDSGIELVLINAPPGDQAKGERGLASLPGREDAFKASIATALEYARILGTGRLHVVAGVMPEGADRARHRDVYVRNIAHAADEARSLGVEVLIEPINPRDMPGFFLNTQAEAHAIRAEIGRENLKVQMDFYHCQIVEGDLTRRLERYLPGIGHVQIAGVPLRHEPDEGEVNFTHILGLLDALGYAGWVGCEYRPRAGTSAGLGWARQYLA
ncbi:MAG: 2-oxo-tetronate isomerase [Hyphomicrobiaceae bacterium]|nr:2-oxo-tetronate isomerase [Hyphomicrobiaceae bacterium]